MQKLENNNMMRGRKRNDLVVEVEMALNKKTNYYSVHDKNQFVVYLSRLARYNSNALVVCLCLYSGRYIQEYKGASVGVFGGQLDG